MLARIGIRLADPATTNSVGVFLPKSPEVCWPDADGNLTNDGRWVLSWDAENRLTKAESRADSPSSSRRRIEFKYDAQWRRTEKIVYANNGSAYFPQLTNRFVYDGRNLVAVLDGANNLISSFTWGPDLSGTLQGAGGVGGLLFVTMHTGTSVGTYFCCYDGSGNVAALVDSGSGGYGAQYEYGPFGEVVRATGPVARVNPFRFSSKYQDDETHLAYFGFRYLSLSQGRWLSRDPLGERGGLNLLGFAGNNPVGSVDALGLADNEVVGLNGHWPADPFAMGGAYYAPVPFTLSPTARYALYKVTATLQCAGGAVAAAGGAMLASGGAITEVGSVGLSTPASAPAILVGSALLYAGADNFMVGAKKLVFSVDTETTIEQGTRSALVGAGLSQEWADSWASAVNGTLLGGGGYAYGSIRLACCRKATVGITIEMVGEATAARSATTLGETTYNVSFGSTGNGLLDSLGLQGAKISNIGVKIDPSLTGAELLNTSAHESLHVAVAQNFPNFAASSGRLPFIGAFPLYAEEVGAYGFGAARAGQYGQALLAPVSAFQSLSAGQSISVLGTGTAVGGLWYYNTH